MDLIATQKTSGVLLKIVGKVSVTSVVFMTIGIKLVCLHGMESYCELSIIALF